MSYAPESILYFNGKSAEANGNVSPDALQMMPVTLAFLCMGLKIGGMIMKQVCGEKGRGRRGEGGRLMGEGQPFITSHRRIGGLQSSRAYS